MDPESYRLELPFDIKSLHLLNRDQYLIEIESSDQDIGSTNIPSQTPKSGNLYMLKKESSDDVIPTLLSPITQRAATMSQDSSADVEFYDKRTENMLEIR